MKVLVTGATGFVGAALIKHLAADSEVTVVAMVRPNCEQPKSQDTEYRVGEINSSGEINIFLDDIDIIIHAAGRAHVMRDNAPDPLQQYRLVNTLGTISLARAAAAANVKKFIFLSTIKVYGDNHEHAQCLSISDEPVPNDPYGISKHEAELGLKRVASTAQFSYTVIRPPLIYGPGVKGNLSALVRIIRFKVPLPFKGLRANKRSMIGIENLIDLIALCMRHPMAANKTFLASDHDDVSTARLIELLGDAVGCRPHMFYCPEILLAFVAKVFGLTDTYRRVAGTLRVDTSHTCNLLEWTPPHSIEHGLKMVSQK